MRDHPSKARAKSRKPTELPVVIRREPPALPLFPFTDFFRGFDHVDAVQAIFGDQTKEVIDELKVGFTSAKYMYMGVSDQDGNIRVGTHHLKNSDLRTLYLDVVHELFHVRQFREDRAYFSREHRKYLRNGFSPALYFRSPIEVPAYRYAVDEAKRIGMTREEIVEYLKMGPVDSRVFSGLLRDVGLDRGMDPVPREKLRVSINRNAGVPLFPFTKFFRGFERVEAVRSLFGPRTERVLARLKVEFSGTPVQLIFLDEEEGHLQVGAPYLSAGDARFIYTDVLACLNLIRQSELERTSLKHDRNEASSRKMLVESYASAVRAAKVIGVSDAELRGHLHALSFTMSRRSFREFMAEVGLAPRGSRSEAGAISSKAEPKLSA